MTADEMSKLDPCGCPRIEDSLSIMIKILEETRRSWTGDFDPANEPLKKMHVAVKRMTCYSRLLLEIFKETIVEFESTHTARNN